MKILFFTSELQVASGAIPQKSSRGERPHLCFKTTEKKSQQTAAVFLPCVFLCNRTEGSGNGVYSRGAGLEPVLGGPSVRAGARFMFGAARMNHTDSFSEKQRDFSSTTTGQTR